MFYHSSSLFLSLFLNLIIFFLKISPPQTSLCATFLVLILITLSLIFPNDYRAFWFAFFDRDLKTQYFSHWTLLLPTVWFFSSMFSFSIDGDVKSFSIVSMISSGFFFISFIPLVSLLNLFQYSQNIRIAFSLAFTCLSSFWGVYFIAWSIANYSRCFKAFLVFFLSFFLLVQNFCVLCVFSFILDDAKLFSEFTFWLLWVFVAVLGL